MFTFRQVQVHEAVTCQKFDNDYIDEKKQQYFWILERMEFWICIVLKAFVLR